MGVYACMCMCTCVGQRKGLSAVWILGIELTSALLSGVFTRTISLTVFLLLKLRTSKPHKLTLNYSAAQTDFDYAILLLRPPE